MPRGPSILLRDIVVDGHESAIKAFIALQLIGGTGLLLIAITAAFSKNVRRLTTWYSFCLSWIVSCISYSLLTFAGSQTGPPPNQLLCTTQAALIYAVPSLTACTTLALVIHMLMNFRFTLSETPFETSPITIAMLLITPYAIWLVLFIGVFAYAIENPDAIRRPEKGTYCDSTAHSWSEVSATVVVITSVAIIIIQSLLAFRLYRNRKIVVGSKHLIATAIRVMVFSFIAFLALGVAVAYAISAKHDQAFDLLLASIPVLAAVIFGSQLDIIHVWMFWRYRDISLPILQRSKTYISVPDQDRV